MQAKKRVLIVDDHPLMREGLAQLIGKQRDLIACGEAATAADAKSAVERDAPDVVILDLMLGYSDGLDLIKFLKAIAPQVPVLVISMHDETVYAERALLAGAMGYITKQEASDKVLDAVRAVLRGEAFLSGRMRALLSRSGGEPVAALPLSDRELHVFRLIGAGLPTRQIAERLTLSVKTIESYRENIKVKLGLADGAALSARAHAWVDAGSTNDDRRGVGT